VGATTAAEGDATSGGQISFEVLRSGQTDKFGSTVVFTLVSPDGSFGADDLALVTVGGTPLTPDPATGRYTLTFAPGEASQIVNVIARGDTVPEGNATFRLTVTGGGGFELPLPVPVTGTFTNDDVFPEVSLAAGGTVATPEGDATGGTISVTIQRTGDLSYATGVTFRLASTGGTTDDDIAIVANGGTSIGSGFGDFAITFAPGEATRTINIIATGDTLAETDESFVLSLLGATEGTLSTTGALSVTGTFANDDAPASPNDPVSGSVTITGPAVEGGTLTAVPALADADGLGAFDYQWFRDGEAILDATDSTFTLGSADVDTEITVRVSFTDGGGTAEAVTSGGRTVTLDGRTGGAGDDTLIGNDLRNPISGAGGNDSLVGLGANDSLFGGTGRDTLVGGAGADLMAGGAGDDLYVLNGADTLVEAAGGGRDTVRSSVGLTLGANLEVLLLTGAGNIGGTGNGLANSITGNGGRNVLNGGLGLDVLTGGAGRDAFVFSTAISAGNIDRITDFRAVDDTIRIDNAVFTGLAAGTLTAAAFRSNTTGTAGDLSDRIIYERDTGRIFFDADGTGGGPRKQFALVDANLTLTAGDFFVI
jgi:Ca2+-binding RTX toxin-like protein